MCKLSSLRSRRRTHRYRGSQPARGTRSARRGRDCPTPEASARKDVGAAAQSTLLKEVEMLLHLPIAIPTTPFTHSRFRRGAQVRCCKECRFEGGSIAVFDRCSHDETEALRELQGSGAASGVVVVCWRQQDCLLRRSNGCRLRELCRPVDLPGNGKGCRQ